MRQTSFLTTIQISFNNQPNGIHMVHYSMENSDYQFLPVLVMNLVRNDFWTDMIVLIVNYTEWLYLFRNHSLLYSLLGQEGIGPKWP